MRYIEQEIILRTKSDYGQDVPLSVSSPLLRHLASTARPSVRMLLEGTSASIGPPPAWLEKASDIRTRGFTAKDGASVLHVSAPALRDAAPQLFEQQSLWPAVALPQDTALQLIGKIAIAVARREAASDLFDRPLLKHFSPWNTLFKHELRTVEFPLGIGISESVGQMDCAVAENAQYLSDQTPPSRQVRVVGKLDMVRHSTRSFGLLLDNGDEVRGVLVEGTSDTLQNYFGKDVTLVGKAVYRPSGTLLRIDAAELLPTSTGRQAFSKVPAPLGHPRNPERRLSTVRSGVAAFFGTWPGNETDHELREALEEIGR